MAKFPLQSFIFLMQKRSSFSTTTTTSSFTVDYLVNSCGVPSKSAIAASRTVHLHLKNLQRYDLCLDLFKSIGFDNTHIAAIMEKRPQILSDHKADTNLRPKLDFLSQNGFSGPHLRDLLISNPDILRRSLTARIKPSLDCLRAFLGSDDRIRLAAKRHSRLFTNDLSTTLLPNIDLFLGEGVSVEIIAKFFMNQPNLLQQRVDRLVSALEIVKGRLGVHPSAHVFLSAVTIIASSGVSLWEKKIRVFESFGFSQEEALSVFRRFPGGFTRSEEMLRTKLEFYLGTVGLKVDDILSYPQILSYAIDSRSRPRHNVLKLLLSKKLLKKDAKLACIFITSEQKFLNKFVVANLQKVPDLLEMYNSDKIAKKIGQVSML